MLHRHARQRCQRTLPVIARLMRIDGGGLQQFAGGIHHRHLAPGTQARIETQHRLRTGRCRQQQFAQIARENLDCLALGFAAQLHHQFGRQMQRGLDAPGEAADIEQPVVRSTALALNADMRGDGGDTGMRIGSFQFLAQPQADAQYTQRAAPKQRQRPMRGNTAQGFAVGVVVTEFFFFCLFLARHHAGCHDALLLQARAQLGQ